MKKFLSILLSLAMAVTAMAAFAVSSSASGIADTAKSIKSGEWNTVQLSYSQQEADFKVKVSEEGKLKINISSKFNWTEIYVYDAGGNYIRADSQSASVGDVHRINGGDYLEYYANSAMEKAEGKATYSVLKGTYYIRMRNGSTATDTAKIKITYPSADGSSDTKVSYLSVTLAKGSTLQLGAVLSDGKDGTAEWSSSKTSVATVNSKGKVTAKAKGTAIITAKAGDSSVKIKVKVTA